jgi:tripartite-type tricarboxylate transporter receptor subunit TctC
MLGLIKKLGGLVAVAALSLAAGAARAENFPTKPVHILVPYAAGGAVDVLARTLARPWPRPGVSNR